MGFALASLLGYFAYSEGWLSIGDKVLKVKYENLGNYSPQTYISKDKKGRLNYVSYYPKGGINRDIPIVLFVKGGGNSSIYGYSGIMKFMASKGYYVIGVDTNSYESWYIMKYLEKAFNEIKKENNLNASKIAVIGHSLGGGQVFYIMNELQKRGYGKKGSLAVSIDGWFAFGMNEENLTKLEGNVAFIQMNGLKGTGTDPRINLKIWSLLKQAEKAFYILPSKNHNYVAGNLTEILEKKDLLFIIGALCYDAFNNSYQGQMKIPQKNKATYNEVFNTLEAENSYMGGDCKGLRYKGMTYIKQNNIDYCTLE